MSFIIYFLIGFFIGFFIIEPAIIFWKDRLDDR
jgi:hypothetical protein